MSDRPQTKATVGYEFKGGFPIRDTPQRAYDDADLGRAIQAYRFFCSWRLPDFEAVD